MTNSEIIDQLSVQIDEIYSMISLHRSADYGANEVGWIESNNRLRELVTPKVNDVFMSLFRNFNSIPSKQEVKNIFQSTRLIQNKKEYLSSINENLIPYVVARDIINKLGSCRVSCNGWKAFVRKFSEAMPDV